MNKHIPGTQLAAQLFSQPNGATMAEIIAATGGPQYNVLKRLKARGYRLRKIREGKETRYYADPPPKPFYEATVTSKGQVTLPKEVRERLRIGEGDKVRFTVESGTQIVLARAEQSIRDLFGILGKPRRSATLDDMDEAVRQHAVERYLRSKG
jgi:AbrB family looped-hinge helix DNA binding protein